MLVIDEAVVKSVAVTANAISKCKDPDKVFITAIITTGILVFASIFCGAVVNCQNTSALLREN